MIKTSHTLLNKSSSISELDQLTQVHAHPLCIITFCFPNQKENHSLNIFEGMTIQEITECICEEINCNYEPIVQQEVKKQLECILMEGKSSQHMNEEDWKRKIQYIISGKEKIKNDINSLAFSSNSNKYFRNNFAPQTQKSPDPLFLFSDSTPKKNDIYTRSQLKLKQKQQKLCKVKRETQLCESSKCTFRPQVNHKKGKQNQPKESKNHNFNESKKVFQRLYEHSFEVKNKKYQKIRTLENQEQNRVSEFSFIPQINKHSRQICRVRSYASFISNFQELQNQIYEKSETAPLKNKAKKIEQNIFTFQPKISENTKKLIKNLPCLNERTSLQKESLKMRKKKVEEKKVKVQTFIIDEVNGNENSGNENKGNELEGEKTERINIPFISPANFRNSKNKLRKQIDSGVNNEKQIKQISQIESVIKNEKRSKELYNKRKKFIFESIFTFLVNSHLSDQKLQISSHILSSHPFVPEFVQLILTPIKNELQHSGLTLDKEEFIWAIDKLFDGLSISDKGSLLGWGLKLVPEQTQ